MFSSSSRGGSKALHYIEIPFDADHPFGYLISHYAQPTEGNYTIHIHQGLEIGIVLRGQSRHIYDNYSYIANPGQIWFSGLWEPHGIEIIEPDTSHLIIEILPDFLRTPQTFSRPTWLEIFQMPPKDRPQALNKEDQDYSLQIADKIIHLIEQDSNYKLNWLRLALKEFLLHFTENIDLERFAQMEEKSNALFRLYPAMILVEKSYGEKITLNEAAKAAKMSRSLFASLFQEIMGISFQQYRLRIQIAAAINKLKTTDKKLEVIAQECGFTDASYLIRTFKSIVKQTPNEYRRDSQKYLSETSLININLLDSCSS